MEDMTVREQSKALKPESLSVSNAKRILDEIRPACSAPLAKQKDSEPESGQLSVSPLDWGASSTKTATDSVSRMATAGDGASTSDKGSDQQPKDPAEKDHHFVSYWDDRVQKVENAVTWFDNRVMRGFENMAKDGW